MKSIPRQQGGSHVFEAAFGVSTVGCGKWTEAVQAWIELNNGLVPRS